MIGNSFHQLFTLGANLLATMPIQFGSEQQAAGFTKDEWDLLTQKKCWNNEEVQKLPTLINSLVSITLRIGGLPSTPLPGAYVAASICSIIAPCNRFLAASAAPESYDAMSASGIQTTSEIITTSREQMYALVTYFTSAEFGALSSFRLNDEIEDAVIQAQIDANI